MKKLFALLMAVTLTFQLVTPVFAEDPEQANADTLPQETEVLVDETEGPDKTEEPAETEGSDETEEPTEADAPSAATETDETGAAETVPTEAEPSEETGALIRVTFIRTPADLTLTVYAEDTDVEIDPQEDDTYLLAPGEYTYLAELDGYISEENTFTVSEVDEANREISVELQSADVEDDASFDSGDYSLQLSRIDELYERIKKNGGFFTVNKQTCGIITNKSHISCSNCKLLNVVNSSWFISEFGSSVTCKKFARNQTGESWTCNSFATFAGWFVNRETDNDAVETASRTPGSFSFDFFSSNAQPGDSLYMSKPYIGQDGKEHLKEHFAIFISCNEQGVYVLDSNWAGKGEPACKVTKHTIPYSRYTSVTISHLQSKQGGHTQQTAPAAPTNFKAVYVDNARAKLSWSASSGATSYEVQYWSVGSNAWKTDTSYSSGTSYTSTGLKNYSSWTFRVRAVNSAGKSDWVSCNYEKTHTHSYKQEFEAAHPHKVYMKCSSCGDWYYTGATTTVDSCTQCHPPVQQVYLDLKGYLDGRDSDSLENFGTCDVYINDVKVADDCTDFYRAYPVGTKYSIKDIRATDGHKYIGEKPFVDEDGNTSIRFEDDNGTISGTLKKDTEVVLEFETTSHGGKCGDNLTWTLDGNGVLTISGSGAMSNFSAHQNVAPWLENWDKIARVVVEPGVTSIGDYAFYGCSSLTSVRIPDGVKSIESDAFRRCSGLTSVRIPDGVTSIGWGAFAACSSLSSITIPESVTSIEGDAFSLCSSLSSITIPESVTSIGEWAFEGCSSLTSVRIPDGVTSIEKETFSGCRSLTSIAIPESVTSIEVGAFFLCSSLTSVRIPDGVTSIGNYAFQGCSSLTGITIPESVTSIENETFSGCSSLTSITIPKRVTSIGERAFYDCSSLSSITIPESVTSIENETFSGCSSLTSVRIPDGVTSIGWNAFYGCSGLTSITIPESVTSIGGSAFSGCSSLTSVRIPDGVTSIGNWAFSGCSSLTSIAIPEGVTSIGEWAFEGCSSLTSITIPAGVTNIGKYAFRDCSSLSSITIPESVTSIEGGTFYGCSSLTSVRIPESVTSIGNYVFFNCSSLTSITIPAGVTSIGEWAFDCVELKDVYYGGAKTDWNQIDIAKGNTSLLNATIHYQIQSISEIRPVDTSTLDGGATLKLTLWSIDQNKQIGATWSLAEGSEAYASITASGTLTAKAVIEPVEITVIAQPTNGEPTATKTIRITPKATALLLMRDGEVLGETLNADMHDLQALTLTAIKNTMEEAQGIHWSTSAKTVAQVDAKGLVTLLKPGTAVIQATDSGKLTGKVTLNVTYTDKSPRLEATTLNLNTALSGGVTVDFVEAYGNGVEALQWNDERFLFEYQENRLTVSAKDALKNGTYPVSLTAACSDGRTYAYPLTLKVTNTLPKVTVKQTAKLNLFYRDSESTLTITGGEVERAAFIGNSNFALENENGQWFIRYADPENIPAKPGTKVTLSVLFAGYNTPVTKSVTIATVNTSPKLKLSPSSSVLNTVLTEALEVRTQLAGTDDDNLSVWTDTPGAEVYLDDGTLTIELSAAKAVTVNVYVQSDSWAKPVKLTHKVSVTTKKPTLKAINSTLKLNSYFPSETASTGLVLSQGNLSLSMVELTPTAKAGAAATESEKLSVSYDLDSEEIVAEILDSSIKNGTYSFTCVGTLEDGTAISGGTVKVSVTNTLPKAKLSASTVRLNKRLTGEEATVKVSLTGGNGYTVTGFENLPDFMWYEDGILTVTLPEQSGTYPLYATVSRGGEEAVLPTAVKLTVQVYDKVPSFRLSAKGKLDVLDPDSKIIYTPKLTNALGTATDVELTGASADLFDAEVVNGTIHLTLAKSGDNYSTKATCKIIPLLTICGQQVKGPTLSIKVTQSALKLASLPNRTVYTSQATPLVQTLHVTAPAAAEVGDVTLNAKTSAALRSALDTAGGLQSHGATIAFPAKAFTGLKPGNYTVILDIIPINAASDSKPTQAKFTLTVKK